MIWCGGEMDPDQLARAFVEHYYTTFDANRAGLASLYQDESMLTFEGQKIQGSPNIVAKLTSLPFQQCQHSITTVDCQPSGPAGGMLVFVSGNLQLAGEQHALKFSQVPISNRSDSRSLRSILNFVEFFLLFLSDLGFIVCFLDEYSTLNVLIAMYVFLNCSHSRFQNRNE